MVFRTSALRHRVGGALFIEATLLGFVLAALFRWPRSNAFVYFVTLRPAWVWFGMLVPFLCVGSLGLRARWVLYGVLFWVLSFCLCEEIVPVFRISHRIQRREFETAHVRAGQSEAANVPPDNHQVIALRIVTWNLAVTPDTVKPALEQLAALGPDIAFLQECSWGHLLPHALADTSLFAEYRLLQRLDNAILTRFPSSAQEDPQLAPSEGQVCVLQVANSVSVTCINLHSPPPAATTELWPHSWDMWAAYAVRTRARLERLGKLAQRHIDAGPVIVAGDFNLPGSYVDLKRAFRRFDDAFLLGGQGWGKTVPAQVPMSRIDLIYVPQSAIVVGCRALPTRASDHRPVVADVLLRVAGS